MTTHRATRRVHLARDGLGLTVCGLLVAGLSERSERDPATGLVAASLGSKGVWRPSWAMTPPAWRCARCKRALTAWQASRTRTPPP